MALQRSAYYEANDHCQKGLKLFERLPDTLEHVHLELALRKLLNTALVSTHGYTAEELAQNLRRAQELCQETGNTVDLVPVLTGLGRLYQVRAARIATEAIAAQECRLLESVHDPLLALQLHSQLASINVMGGAPVRALAHQQQALTLYDATAHHALFLSFGIDPMVTVYGLGSWSAWFAGYPELAQSYLEKGLAHADSLSNLFSRVLIRANGAQLFLFRHEPDAALSLAQQGSALAHAHGIPQDVITGSIMQSCIALQQGGTDKEIAAISEGLEQYRMTCAQLHLPFYLSVLAEGYMQLGRLEEGLQAVCEALQLCEVHFDRYWEAELYRLKGELLRLNAERRMQNDERQSQEQGTSSIPHSSLIIYHSSFCRGRSVFPQGHRDCSHTTSKVTRAACDDESRPSLATARKAPPSTHYVVCDLWLVHGGF